MPGDYSVIIVDSTGHAIKAEKALLKMGMRCKLIPVPRQISSNCGVCVRVERADQEAARQALRQAGVEIASVHDA
jgi:hypothetical protein